MKKEIGSIFPLNNKEINAAEKEKYLFSKERLYYSLCREALSDIALSFDETHKRVLIPAFTCQTVITPFEEAGWECIYYAIDKKLRIDINHLLLLVEDYHPNLVITHPYFGMDLNNDEIDAFQQIHHSGIKVVLDLTQCLFSTSDTNYADYIVGSYRKWFPIPDGGYMVRNDATRNILQPQSENTEFTERELSAMYLRGQYFINGEQRTKDISIRLSKAADHLAESNICSHKMSQIAYNLLQKEDMLYNQKVRKDNFNHLHNHILSNNKITKVCNCLDDVTTAPLYFTIYVEDRKALQMKLAKDSIYAPVIWPVEDERVLINDEVTYIYNHLLAIPCDQRYDTLDMQRAVDIINYF